MPISWESFKKIHDVWREKSTKHCFVHVTEKFDQKDYSSFSGLSCLNCVPCYFPAVSLPAVYGGKPVHQSLKLSIHCRMYFPTSRTPLAPHTQHIFHILQINTQKTWLRLVMVSFVVYSVVVWQPVSNLQPCLVHLLIAEGKNSPAGGKTI